MILFLVRIKSHENIISKNDLKCTTLSHYIPISPTPYFFDPPKKNLSIGFRRTWASIIKGMVLSFQISRMRSYEVRISILFFAEVTIHATSG